MTNPPVVIYSVDVLVRSDAKQQFLTIMDAMKNAINAHEGFLHIGIEQEGSAAGEHFRVVAHFKTEGELTAWLRSATHQHWTNLSIPLVAGPVRTTVRTGMEGWVPNSSSRTAAPSRVKTVLVTWLALFPTILFLGVVSDFIGMQALPAMLTQFLLTGIATVLMTYLIMPKLTAWLSAWLRA